MLICTRPGISGWVVCVIVGVGLLQVHQPARHPEFVVMPLPLIMWPATRAMSSALLQGLRFMMKVISTDAVPSSSCGPGEDTP